MRDDAFRNTRVFPDRDSLMRAIIAPHGIGAELGVQRGIFSRFMLDNLQPTELHLFDLTTRLMRKDVADDPGVKLHIGDSSTLLAGCKDIVFDWIHIDGDHSRAGVQKDAVAARQRIRPGGLIVFNDYTKWSVGEAMPYGVMPVANELVNQGLNFEAIALNPWGYFDVALSEPVS